MRDTSSVFDRGVVCVEMEQGNQRAVSASTASSSQNSLKGSGAASSSKNSTTSGGGGKVAVTKRKRSVLTLERKLEIISEVKKGKSVRQCLDSLVFQNLQ